MAGPGTRRADGCEVRASSRPSRTAIAHAGVLGETNIQNKSHHEGTFAQNGSRVRPAAAGPAHVASAQSRPLRGRPSIKPELLTRGTEQLRPAGRGVFPLLLPAVHGPVEQAVARSRAEYHGISHPMKS